MDKTFGKNKYKYIYKNKFKKTQKYSNHRNKASLHKPLRMYVNSYINHNINNKQKLEDFIFPSKSPNTYIWWDCKPFKPKVL
jgi:hypothetical protein